MPDNLLWSLIILGSLAIVALLLYIRKLVNGLKELKEQQQALQDKAEEQQKTLQLDVVESLKVITTVMLEDQLDLSEGCLRIKVLIDNLDVSLHDDERFKIFSVMAEALAHMPTHSARKQVEKKILRKLDEQRFKLEAQHRDEIRKAGKLLLSWLEHPLKAVE